MLISGRRKSIIDTISRGSISLLNGARKDSRLVYANNRNSITTPTPKFSEMTSSGNNKPTRNIARIQQKINKKKIMDENSGSDFKVRNFLYIFFSFLFFLQHSSF